MEIQGRVHNGVVVMEGDVPWPEGAVVTVLILVVAEPISHDHNRRVELPMVRSKQPGSRLLTAGRLGEILE